MLRAYREVNSTLHQVESIEQPGTWVELVAPTEEEIETVSTATGLLPEFLKVALDEEERPRQEAEKD